jgi:tetratricopeptide (TPR) repeat protein
MSNCPPPETWPKYLRDQLSPDQDRALTDHVQGCPNCEEALARLVEPCHSPRSAAPAPPAELVEQLRGLWAAAFPPDDLADPACWPRIEGYELGGILGRGGTGVVYRAWDVALGREVALKMIASGSLPAAADVQRLLNEARNTAQLHHPHIVPIYAVGEHGGRPYCVMELIEGGSLAQRIADLVAEPSETARLVAAAARALHHAHLHDLCHRDVKPANFLLRPRGPALPGPTRLCDFDVCVTDFGLARRSRDETGLTLTGAIVGTPGYMSPEQIRSETPRPAGDVYGLGAVLYHCLTGQPPSGGATPFDTLLRTLQQEPERPRVLNSRLPRDLETICLKCLEKDPKRRYISAATLADDLERWLRGEPVQARRIGPLGRTRRWCRRNPGLAVLLAALALALLGGFTGILTQWQKAEAARTAAEASDAQTRQLLNELLQSSPDAPLPELHVSRRLPSLDALHRAEAHFHQQLRNNPGDVGVRISLTNIRGSLGALSSWQGRLAEMETWFQGARDLWEQLAKDEPGNPDHRDWLARTITWQTAAAVRQEDSVRYFRLILHAHTLWHELAQEQPSNRDLLQRVADRRRTLVCVRLGQEEVIRALQEDRVLLGKQLAPTPDDQALRLRLAMTCLVLAGCHLDQRAPREALSCWRQAHEEYRKLARAKPADPLLKLDLALCCCRLMDRQATEPYYSEAVGQLEEAGKRLAALLRQHPSSDWSRQELFESYCWLFVCHIKAGRTKQAERVFQEQVRPLAAQVSEHLADPRPVLDVLVCLWRAADCLREVSRPATLALAREAAALAGRCIDAPLRSLTFTYTLAMRMLSIATLLCQQGDPAESLHQAEQARRLLIGLRHVAPEVAEYGDGLRGAWERIAKARWELGQRDLALAAFRESTAVQRQVVRQAPTVRLYRIRLSKCCDKLVYWAGLAGDRATVAAALLERKQLWPDDADRLLEVSRDFHKLAESVGKGPKQLSPTEKLEQQRYLAESDRTRRAAEAVRSTKR